jgi:hypothetical protein
MYASPISLLRKAARYVGERVADCIAAALRWAFRGRG